MYLYIIHEINNIRVCTIMICSCRCHSAYAIDVDHASTCIILYAGGDCKISSQKTRVIRCFTISS